MYKDMLPAFHKILSSILVLIPVFIFFYDIFLFYFHKKNKINQSLTSDSLKLFKDKAEAEEFLIKHIEYLKQRADDFLKTTQENIDYLGTVKL